MKDFDIIILNNIISFFFLKGNNIRSYTYNILSILYENVFNISFLILERTYCF